MRHLERFVWAVLLGGFVLGCPESSMPPFVGSDAGRDAPDAPVCDRDGDGADGPQCGGPDCDDDEPRLSDARSFCLDAQTQRRCSPTAIDATCPDVCDARTGTCATEACGDGVVHEGEECDERDMGRLDGCEPDCRLTRCVRSRDCPNTFPICSGVIGSENYCRLEGEGLSLGANCESDVECAHGMCDPRSHQCTMRCQEHRDCEDEGPWDGWCHPDRGTCHWDCTSDRSCFEGETCVRTGLASQRTLCEPASGHLPDGAGCRSWTDECINVCAVMMSWECTSICSVDDDCDSSRYCSLFREPGTHGTGSPGIGYCERRTE